MLTIERYHGKEQTYLKHFVLEKYLQRLAYHIGLGWKEKPLLYVDCFSGPWKSQDEQYKDTSFVVAIEVLRKVRDDLSSKGIAFTPRCIFVERDGAAFHDLTNAIANVDDIQIDPLPGDFESLVPEILARVGSDFTLAFVDPTGWAGFDLSRIKFLLQHRPGEVIINFMFSFIHRFLSKADPGYPETFDALFGGRGWEHLLDLRGQQQENATLDFYCERLASQGDFEFVTHTRILNPLKDATYFYLVYATRHCKGLEVFRSVEKSLVTEQDKARTKAKQTRRIERTSQPELFDDVGMGLVSEYFKEERQHRLDMARQRVQVMIDRGRPIDYETLKCDVLRLPSVWESDVNAILTEFRKSGAIEIPQLKGRERVPKAGYWIVPTRQ